MAAIEALGRRAAFQNENKSEITKGKPMKLYHCEDARSLRPLWTLEEMGLDYELVNMEFPPRLTYPGYLDLNPMGTVPTFIDGDVTITESTGICHYLVKKYGPTELSVDTDDPSFGEYLNWLYRSDATASASCLAATLGFTLTEPASGAAISLANSGSKPSKKPASPSLGLADLDTSSRKAVEDMFGFTEL